MGCIVVVTVGKVDKDVEVRTVVAWPPCMTGSGDSTLVGISMFKQLLHSKKMSVLCPRTVFSSPSK